MPIEFWFEFASTYSYPAAMRIESVAAAHGVTVHWKPFLLGPIFKAQGWSDSPFNIYAAKGRYMWRDLERICADLDLPLVRPTAFPRNGLIAARIACLFSDAPWAPAFIRAVYRANFAEDREIGERVVIADCLREIGQDPEPLLAAADAPEAKAQLKRQTDAAVQRGIFGAPSFTVGSELFWGSDRLERAVQWCAAQAE